MTVLGPTDLPSHVAQDASQMYARNVTALLDHVLVEDEMVAALNGFGGIASALVAGASWSPPRSPWDRCPAWPPRGRAW